MAILQLHCIDIKQIHINLSLPQYAGQQMIEAAPFSQYSVLIAINSQINAN